MSKFVVTVLPFIPTLFGHPFYLLVAFQLTLGLGLGQTVSTNLVQVNLVGFALICATIAAARFGLLLILCALEGQRIVPAKKLIRPFCLNHWPATAGLLILPLLLIPIEGNILGFIISPLCLLFSLIIGPVVLIKNLELCREATGCPPDPGFSQLRR
ncbi:MAG: hypothetical protein AAGI71_17315 [Bacteroidota bacterium]